MSQGLATIGSGGFRDVYPISVSCASLSWIDRQMVSKHFHNTGRAKVTGNFPDLSPQRAIDEETRVTVQLNETVMALSKRFNEAIEQTTEPGAANPRRVRYNKVYLVEDDANVTTFTIEDYITGSPWKVLLNSGLPDKSSSQPEDSTIAELSHAFAHFTLQYTNDDLIVLDVQGVGTYFMDPAVCTNSTLDPNEERGDSANLFAESIKNFKEQHVCNHFCAAANLSSLRWVRNCDLQLFIIGHVHF